MENKSSVYGVDVCKATLVIGRYGSDEVFSISNTPEHIARWLSTIAAGSVVAWKPPVRITRCLPAWHMRHTCAFMC
jgi:hypothetical protein